MMPIRLFLLLTLAITFVILHALPFLPRPDRLFGLIVPREVRYGAEGRQALHRYQFCLLPWTAAALVASLCLSLSWAAIWTPAAGLIPLYVAGWLFIRQRAAMRRFALPVPPTREAPLSTGRDRLYRQMLLFVLPLALLAGTALYLRLHWDQIPARLPIHWGLNGTPNSWATRSFAGVYGPLLIGGGVVLNLFGVFLLSHWGSRRSARHPAGQIVLIGVSYVIAIAFSMVGLLPLRIVPVWVLTLFPVGSFVLLGALVWISIRQGARTAATAGEMTPDDYWHGDLFYSNPNDPALFVEKRVGVGLTLNFGNRIAWVVLALLLLVPAGLVLLAFAVMK